jgi:hypothetical protein
MVQLLLMFYLIIQNLYLISEQHLLQRGQMLLKLRQAELAPDYYQAELMLVQIIWEAWVL